MIDRWACGLALALMLSATAAHAERPTKATGVQPLLVGAKVPAVAGLIDGQGGKFDLNAALAGKVSVLIFYRGHW